MVRRAGAGVNRIFERRAWLRPPEGAAIVRRRRGGGAALPGGDKAAGSGGQEAEGVVKATQRSATGASRR